MCQGCIYSLTLLLYFVLFPVIETFYLQEVAREKKVSGTLHICMSEHS